MHFPAVTRTFLIQVGTGLECQTVRGFEKRLADRGGWREEILPLPQIQASFLHPLSFFLGEGGHNSGDQFSLLQGNK